MATKQAPAFGWTSQDFANVHGMMDVLAHVLSGGPERFEEFRELLASDLETARESFRRIVDGLGS